MTNGERLLNLLIIKELNTQDLVYIDPHMQEVFPLLGQDRLRLWLKNCCGQFHLFRILEEQMDSPANSLEYSVIIASLPVYDIAASKERIQLPFPVDPMVGYQGCFRFYDLDGGGKGKETIGQINFYKNIGSTIPEVVMRRGKIAGIPTELISYYYPDGKSKMGEVTIGRQLPYVKNKPIFCFKPVLNELSGISFLVATGSEKHYRLAIAKERRREILDGQKLHQSQLSYHGQDTHYAPYLRAHT